MTISELREMTKREYALWFSKAKATDLKEILNNENLGGGISKFTKAMLIEVVMDLVDNIETELTSKLKPKRTNKKKTNDKNINGKDKKQEEDKINKDNVEQSDGINEQQNNNTEKTEEELMFEELMLPRNTQDFTGFYFNKSGRTISQSGYFTISGTKKENRAKYLKLIKYYHPDKATGDEEKFKIIQDAWEKAQLKFDLDK